MATIGDIQNDRMRELINRVYDTIDEARVRISDTNDTLDEIRNELDEAENALQEIVDYIAPNHPFNK